MMSCPRMQTSDHTTRSATVGGLHTIIQRASIGRVADQCQAAIFNLQLLGLGTGIIASLLLFISRFTLLHG